MNRAGREPAEDLKRHLVAVCAEVGQEARATIHFGEGVRFFNVATPMFTVIACVPFSGEWPETGDMRCGTTDCVYDPWDARPRGVPLGDLAQALRDTPGRKGESRRRAWARHKHQRQGVRQFRSMETR